MDGLENIEEKLEKISGLVDEVRLEIEKIKLEKLRDTLPLEKFNAECEWGDSIGDRTYLELAKQDYNTILKNKNDLKNSAHTVTVLISQVFEKCFCHLLMLKGKEFIPSHKHANLLRKVRNCYPSFPESIGSVEASLCEAWYQTNRYPQRQQRGYENYYIILNMITLCDELIEFCNLRTESCKGIDFDINQNLYKITDSINDDEFASPIRKENK